MEPAQDPPPHEQLLAERVDADNTTEEDGIAKMERELLNLDDEPDQVGGTGAHDTTGGSPVPRLSAKGHRQQGGGDDESRPDMSPKAAASNPPPSTSAVVKNKPNGRLKTTEDINIAMFEDMGSPKSAARPGKNLDFCLTFHHLPGQRRLDRAEREFFETFLHTLTKAKKKMLKKAPEKKRLKPSQSSKPRELQHRLQNSHPLPVTRHVIHREDIIIPCDHFNPVRTQGSMRQDKPSKHVPQPKVPSSPALPISTPIERASSATIVSSPTLASTPAANQGTSSGVSGPPIDLYFDPTSRNTDTHIWNWRTRTFEPVMPDKIRYEHVPTYAQFLDFELPKFEDLFKL
ncbi:uncharacterized protein J3D65DRAFT_150198 [Phyllosticta citribraziliensis]|uniref:Uncharacterized protein n=1 Tax=Phyllosticta citribraziliensis TaxID=989973 RepID=A0ABR1L4S2_9PEZI